MGYVNLKLSDADAMEKKDSSGVEQHCHQGVYIPPWRAGRGVQSPAALHFLLGRSPGTAGAQRRRRGTWRQVVMVTVSGTVRLEHSGHFLALGGGIPTYKGRPSEEYQNPDSETWSGQGEAESVITPGVKAGSGQQEGSDDIEY